MWLEDMKSKQCHGADAEPLSLEYEPYLLANIVALQPLRFVRD